MVNPHKSKDTIKLAIEYYEKHKVSYLEVVSIFQINEKILRRWIQKYNDDTSIQRKKRNAISYKITEYQVKYLLRLVKGYPTLSVRLLWTKMHEKFRTFNL